MTKSKTLIISAVAAAAVAVSAAAVYRVSSDKNSSSVIPVIGESVTAAGAEEITANTAVTVTVPESGTVQSTSEKTEPSSAEASTAANESTTAEGSTQQAGESTTAAEQTSVLTTVKETVTKIKETVSSVKCKPSDISSSFVIPKSKRYISKYPNVDFSSINLASYKYNAEGNYFYTDDKECWQDNFGYNLVYDKLAAVGHMYYDTIRTVFNYDNKQWLVQLWKGQYGYVFVGAEMGVYTRKIGSKGAYKCADKEDWLYMEMTCYWDLRDEGNFEPVFTRPYTEYWWCTGFVPGWLNNTKQCDEMRLVGRITFKDSDMAHAFANALARSGFGERGAFSVSATDTFTVIGRDVVFNWWKLDDEQ